MFRFFCNLRRDIFKASRNVDIHPSNGTGGKEDVDRSGSRKNSVFFKRSAFLSTILGINSFCKIFIFSGIKIYSNLPPKIFPIFCRCLGINLPCISSSSSLRTPSASFVVILFPNSAVDILRNVRIVRIQPSGGFSQ